MKPGCLGIQDPRAEKNRHILVGEEDESKSLSPDNVIPRRNMVLHRLSKAVPMSFNL